MADLTNCEICGDEIDQDEVEPACEECGLDGCCTECMVQHECLEEGA